MSACVVVHASPRVAAKMQECAAAAGPTLAAFGGKLVARHGARDDPTTSAGLGSRAAPVHR